MNTAAMNGTAEITKSGMQVTAIAGSSVTSPLLYVAMTIEVNNVFSEIQTSSYFNFYQYEKINFESHFKAINMLCAQGLDDKQRPHYVMLCCVK